MEVAVAVEEKAQPSGVINDSRVRLRSEPNLASETLGYVNTGDRIGIIDKSDEKQQIDEMNDYWYKVEVYLLAFPF